MTIKSEISRRKFIKTGSATTAAIVATDLSLPFSNAFAQDKPVANLADIEGDKVVWERLYGKLWQPMPAQNACER